MVSIRVGTRGSKLALWQAEWVAGQLTQRGHEVELVTISTQGDVSKQSLSQVGGQGLFTKEIQRELLSGNVDVAVHSLKDLPTVPIEGLQLAAVPQRETTDDCLISRTGEAFEALPSGARVGTGSSRRGAQLLAWRPDVEIVDIRGNVDSRLRKLEENKYEAIVLAAAGLTRLKLLSRISQVLPSERILPAIGQGALGIECRSRDTDLQAALSALNDASSFAAVTAERALLASLLAGCLAPVAALGQVDAAGMLTLRARVCAHDGSRMLEATGRGPAGNAQALGTNVAEQLRSQGATELIEQARRQIAGDAS
ncbi:MAG: hydroxymethylbilane synthase [Planctomycetales bacterium]|nr:hydroxymethylbilane synthase [Planctomycetales bacterium]